MDRDILRQGAVAGSALALVGLGATGDYGSSGASVSPAIPADPFFAIWGPLFLGNLALAAHQARPALRTDPVLRRVGWPLAAAYLGLGTWSRLFALEELWITLPVLGLTGAAAAAAYARLDPPREAGDPREAWLVRVPVGLLAGWTAVAVLASATDALLDDAVGGLAVDPSALGVPALLLAGAIGLWTARREGGTAALPLAVAWGLVGVTVADLPNAAPVPGAVAGGLAALVAGAVARRLRPRGRGGLRGRARAAPG